ncbi:MAG: glutathione S-transferase family protein [Rhodobacteraceae bacterium]|nr:glutathione S-transferase family protein [Paracoccaceae bacterium]
MKLYSAVPSPFARKCRVCVIENGLENTVELVAAGGSPLDASNMPTTHNPLGKLPALEREDGPAIYDSRVITRYLDHHASGSLYPASHLWETLTLEATADGILDAAVLMVYEARCRDEEIRSPDWIEAQWGKIARALNSIEDRWMSHLAGPLDMAQIAVGCAVEYLDFRHPERNWRAAHPALAEWHLEFSKRPSMAETQPQDT